jgi:Flp pilus assembly pilin Flp
MTKHDIKQIALIAGITMVSTTLPGLLWQRGLPVGWTVALLAGFVTVAVLGYVFDHGRK